MNYVNHFNNERCERQKVKQLRDAGLRPARRCSCCSFLNETIHNRFTLSFVWTERTNGPVWLEVKSLNVRANGQLALAWVDQYKHQERRANLHGDGRGLLKHLLGEPELLLTWKQTDFSSGWTEARLLALAMLLALSVHHSISGGSHDMFK